MLKAGYHLQIVSWENDADNYNTITIVVQDVNEVKFYTEWLELFKSTNTGHADDNRFGNIPDDGWDEEIGKKLLLLTNDLRRKYGLEEIEDTYYLSEAVYEVLGSSEYFAYRVFDNLTIYHIPVDIEAVEV